MKFLFLILAFFVAAQASVLDTRTMMMKDRVNTVTKGDQLFWIRQMKILRLYNHYNMVNGNTDQIVIAKNFKLESLLDMCDDKMVVKHFMMKWRDQLLLHKNDAFSITNKWHREDAKILVNIFLGIKDFDYFYEFACWVREFMNRDLFLYTMNIAVLHRMDCRGMMLPLMYEIVPNKFFNSEIIDVVKNIKMQGGIYDTTTAKRMGIEKMDDTTFLINTFYSCWFLDTNEECKMSYFTEDVDMNNRYNMMHLMQPFWMHMDVDSFMNNRRGEYFLFLHKQLLNRYYLERLSNGLGKIPKFKYDLPITTGMTTTLKHTNGLMMPSRPNNFLINTLDNVWDLKTVKDYERRLRDVIDKGYLTLDDGKMLHMNRPEDIELLGDLIQSNTNAPHRNYYLNGLMIAKRLLGNTLDTTNKMFSAPGIMEQYETALRDPMFWQLWKRIYHYVMKFKYNLRPYTFNEVGLDEVVIHKITTDKLETFFDVCDADISNVVYRDMEEMTRNRDRFTFIARQRCLNHRKFNVNIDYTSDKTMDVMVKIFMGPKLDDRRMRTTLTEDFLQLDHFMVNLKTGMNVITRESTMMWSGIKDITYTKMMDMVEKCTDVGCHIPMRKFNMPNRLLLPKGKMGGMVFQMFVSITPIRTTNVFNKFDTSKMMMDRDFFVDDNAFGYPLDREIDWTIFKRCTNMMIKDVLIFHDVSTDKMIDRVTHWDVMDKVLRYDPLMKTGFMNKDFVTKDYMMDKDTMMMKNRDNMMRMMDKDTMMMMNRDNMMGKGMMDKDTMMMMNRDNMMGKGMMDKDTMMMMNRDNMMGKGMMDKDTMMMMNRDNIMGKGMMDKDTMMMMNRDNMMGKNKGMMDKDTMMMMNRDYMMNKNKDFWMDKDHMTKDFMHKKLMDTDYAKKDFMNKDYLNKDFMTDRFMGKDYLNKDFMTNRFMDKDFMTKHYMDKDFMTKDYNTKNYMNKDFMTNRFMDKDFMNKDFMTKHYMDKNFMNKDFMTKHYMDKDFMNKDYVTRDFMDRDYMNKDMMTKDYITKDFMKNKDYTNKHFMTKDKDFWMNKDNMMYNTKDDYLTTYMNRMAKDKDNSYERRW